jgi:hypothetical protein
MLVAFWALFFALLGAIVAFLTRSPIRIAGRARPFATASEIARSGVARDGGPTSTGALLAALVGWLVYTGLLSWSGWLARVDVRPPAFLFVAPGIVAWVVFAARSKAAKEMATQAPLAALMAVQVFRLPLELLLHGLWKARLLPQMMTYEGANFDIVMGLSAPIVGYLALRGKISQKLLVLWNVVGILLVVHVAARGVLTTPAIAALATDVPNQAIGMFPYTFIATFFVPAALVFHVLTLRKLADR